MCNSTSPHQRRFGLQAPAAAADNDSYLRTCPFWGIARGKGLLHTHGTDGYGGNSDRRDHRRTRAPRLGDRVRQLRIAAGMTQTDLAADRFSKEYISQIERGKTRPTSQTVEWLASRLGVEATFLASGVSSDDRARAEAVLARAEALVQKLDFGGAIDEYGRALSSVVATGSVELQVRRLSGEAWASMHHGEVRAGTRASRARPRPRGGAGVLRSRPRRHRVQARRRALPALEHRDRRRPVRRVPVAPRPLTASLRSSALERLHVARSLLSPPARLRGRARGCRARARAGRVDGRSAHPRRGLPAGVARRRARRPLGARTHLRRAGEGAVRGGGRGRQRRAAAQQPRWARVPARQPREGDRAPQGGVRSRTRPRHRGRRGDGCLIARAGVFEVRRSGNRREACARRAAAAGGTRGSHGRDRERAARARAGRFSSRSGSTRPIERWQRPKTPSPSSLPALIGLPPGLRKAILLERRGDDRQAAVLFRRAAEALQDFRF